MLRIRVKAPDYGRAFCIYAEFMPDLAGSKTGAVQMSFRRKLCLAAPLKLTERRAFRLSVWFCPI